jgi:peptidoglycan/LPS O-acetylase OafA/YrhL
LVDKNWDYGEFNFYNIYIVLQAGFFPFSLGGLSYLYRKQIIIFFREKLGFLFLYLGLLLLSSSYWHFMQYVLGYFLMSAFFAAIVPMIIEKRMGNLYSRIDKLLGDLSYPIFISHWIIASIIFSCTSIERNSFVLFIMTLLGVTLFSLPIIWLERKINLYRNIVKKKARDKEGISDGKRSPA